jgi:hypothetical protein
LLDSRTTSRAGRISEPGCSPSMRLTSILSIS